MVVRKCSGKMGQEAFFSLDFFLLLGHGDIVLLFLASWFRIKRSDAP